MPRTGAREQHALLLPAGKLTVALALELEHTELAEVHQRLGFFLRRVEKARAAVRKAREHDLRDRGGKVALRGRLLGQIPEPALALGGAVDLAGQRGQQTQKRAQQRRFAAAVFAHDAEIVPRADGEGEVLQERLVLVAERNVLAGEDDGRIVHAFSPFLSASKFRSMSVR